MNVGNAQQFHRGILHPHMFPHRHHSPGSALQMAMHVLLLTSTTFGMKLHNFQFPRTSPPQPNTLHTPQRTNTPPPPPLFPPVTSITILKSSPTCLITLFPHQEKAKIDSESFTSKLQQTCETPRSLSAMCHLSLFKTSRTNEYRQMCHPAGSSPTTDPISRCRVLPNAALPVM